LSVETDLAVIGPAACEAAALVAEALDLEARPGEGFDLWGNGRDSSTEAVPKKATVWSAPFIGALGPCGEIALVLPPGVTAPAEASVASALARGIPPLTGAFGAARIGEIKRSSAEAVTTARPGHRALAVPLLVGSEPAPADAQAGLLVFIAPAAEVVAELPHLDPSPGPTMARSIAAFGEVEMSVSVELGRTKLPIRELLSIHNGAVVQLDRPVTHPVDLYVQGTLIARGEVVVVDECFAVRVTELLTGE
jgi:flagellar motor switch protein FliN/FliY